MWPTSNKSIHQKLMDQYDEKLPEMFADGSNVSNEEKAVLHMDLNYNLRIGFRKKVVSPRTVHIESMEYSF